MKKGLSPRQRQAALMLASGYTSKKTAEVLGVTPKTLCQWNARPDFRSLVDKLLAETQAEATRALSGLSARAVERLAELLDSTNDGTAQRAIETVLDRQTSTPEPVTPSGAGDAWATIMARITAYESEKPTNPH